jgi:translation elongation factor P/translation initiation factor 5A
MKTWGQLRKGDTFTCRDGHTCKVVETRKRGDRQWVRTTRHDHLRLRTDKVES